MIDLINRSAEEVNELIKQYASVLEVCEIKTIEDAGIHSAIIDVSIKHIKNNHNDLSVDWKAWGVTVIVKKLHKQKKLKYEEEVIKEIDDFFNYWKQEYENYCNNLALFVSEFDKDLGFIYQYIETKNSK